MAKIAKTEGEYVVRGPGKNNNEFRFFEEDFALDDSVKDIAQARCIIQNGLLTERLRKIDGFKRWRTCSVLDLIETKEPAPNGDLDVLLLEATTLGCIPESIDNYVRKDAKVKALKKAIETHKERSNGLKKRKETTRDEGYID